jgi:hypothetical protein
VVNPTVPFGPGVPLRMTLRGISPPAVGEVVMGKGEAAILSPSEDGRGPCRVVWERRRDGEM